jgi:signal transduction histidine kinase
MLRAIVGIGLLGAGLVVLAQGPSEDQVKGLVKKASAHVKQAGIEKACKDFADPNGGYIRGEIYVYVHDMQARMICHATNAKLNGKELIDLKDADGKAFNREMVEVVNKSGGGWIRYKFVNPATKKIEPKMSYVEREGDVIVGAGIYVR